MQSRASVDEKFGSTFANTNTTNTDNEQICSPVKLEGESKHIHKAVLCSDSGRN